MKSRKEFREWFRRNKSVPEAVGIRGSVSEVVLMEPSNLGRLFFRCEN